MGLENFSTDDSGGLGQSSQNNTQQSQSTTKQSNSGPYKKVGTPPNIKVIQTEEEWDKIVEVIEDQMGYNLDEVLSWQPSKTYQLFHVAILRRNGNVTEEFRVTRSCMMCGEEYIFPHNWDFVEYKDETVCPKHEIGEVVSKYKEVNKV